VCAELPPFSPKPTPTWPCTQSPGSRPPPGSFSLLPASGEQPPDSGVRTWHGLGFPYHLIFILLLLGFGPWDFQSCLLKQFILFIPRETEGKSSHRRCCCSCSTPQCSPAIRVPGLGENTQALLSLPLQHLIHTLGWPLHSLQLQQSSKANQSDHISPLLKSP
jgi:hypothetical protein